jgi:hypothetical protein
MQDELVELSDFVPRLRETSPDLIGMTAADPNIETTATYL